MIDSLFGSKTRVKLLHLFLNNPGKSFYVREITRLIGEQINSVRRELANMLEVGVITSQSTDNKLFYEVNQRYEYYIPLRAIFAEQKIVSQQDNSEAEWLTSIKKLSGLKIAIISGSLVVGSASEVDLLLVGNLSKKKALQVIESIELSVGRELSYSVLPFDDFYYRLSMRDKFINNILTNKHSVIVDSENVINS